MRNTAAKCIFEYCKQNKNGFLIAGDAGFGVWDGFKTELPEQYINTGINEAATIGLAAGMALSGHRVFVYNIIPFLIMRSYEQVRIDIGYQKLPVIMVGIGSGITYAPSGMTHYSVEDITLAKTIPDLNIISPSDPVGVTKALEYAVNSDCPTFIRLSKSGEPVIFAADTDITKPVTMKDGRDTAIIFHGSIADEVLAAAEQLPDTAVIAMPVIHPLDKEAVCRTLGRYKKIFVVEEHFQSGGLGTILTELAADEGINCKIIRVGIPNESIHHIGNCGYLRTIYGLDAQSIISKVRG